MTGLRWPLATPEKALCWESFLEQSEGPECLVQPLPEKRTAQGSQPCGSCPLGYRTSAWPGAAGDFALWSGPGPTRRPEGPSASKPLSRLRPLPGQVARGQRGSDSRGNLDSWRLPGRGVTPWGTRVQGDEYSPHAVPSGAPRGGGTGTLPICSLCPQGL